MKVAFILFVAAAVAGCASNQAPKLLQSTTAEAAKVRFKSTAHLGAFSIYPENRCNGGTSILFNAPVREAANKLQGYTPPRVAMYDNPYGSTDSRVAEYAFAPGQILNLGASAGGCVKGMSMALKAGEQYEIVLEAGCRLIVSQLKLSNSSIRREPVRDIRRLICDGRGS